MKKEVAYAYLHIVLGCLIGGIAYPLFLTPCGIAPGGLTGVGIICHHLFSWPVGTVSLVLNIPLFILSYRQMGPVFAFRSLIAMTLFSLSIDLLPFAPMTEDPLLATLFGGILLGVGLGMIMRGGATTGGTDMMARLLQKHISFLSVGVLLFAMDFIVSQQTPREYARSSFHQIDISSRIFSSSFESTNSSSNILMNKLASPVRELPGSDIYSLK